MLVTVFAATATTSGLTAVAAPARYTFSKSTCLLTITGHGTCNLSHGTGKYRGITGSGTFTTRGRAIYPRKTSGTCASSHPLAFQAIITLNGPVTKR